MDKIGYFLKEDVYFEPLFNHWYAWPYLLPPVTAARHLVHTHRRIMRSFVNNYQLHIMALAEPELTGGEFLNCTAEQVDDIKALLQSMDENCTDLMDLSESIKELEEVLRLHTSGESIDYIYEKVPIPLRGYVELFLDMEHRASYRLLEPLLYRSSFYRQDLQSISLGLLSNVNERPFVLSTPRLPDVNHLQANIEFSSPKLDTLFKARQVPLTHEELESIFVSSSCQGGLDYLSLFTESAPTRSHKPVDPGSVRLSYTGHAGFLLETNDVAILIDPVIASRKSDSSDELISFNELPEKIDYICLTHNHQDHVNLETLLQLRYKTKKVLVPKNNGGTLADPSIRLMLQKLNFDVTEVDDLDHIPIAGGQIVSIPFFGEHGDLNIRSKTAWFVEIYRKKFFFGADSSNPDKNLYEHLGKIFSDIDVLAIGMECVGAPFTWIYGALYSKPVPKTVKNSRRLNGSDFSQAFPIVNAFKAKQVFLYALGMEPWYNYFMGLNYTEDSKQLLESRKMLDACDKAGIPAEALYGKKIVYL